MKKIISVVALVFMLMVVVIPVSFEESYGAVNVRTSMPSYSSAEGRSYYYSDNNLFYKYNLGPNQKYISSYGGYVTGNCTWYAYARASEMSGKWINSNFRWSASKWWDINKSNNYYPYGSTPKIGAIACYSNHVAVVEKVINGKPYVSESGWKTSKYKPTSASNLVFHYGTPWYGTVKGYIYVNDTESNDIDPVNYNVKVDIKNLNMRTGPSTSYSRVGYIKPGTYTIIQESNGWGKLKDSGYWIALRYATKVTETTPPPSNDATGQESIYKVEIKISNLNLRTGPSTSYARKGYAKPGVYDVVSESNGWCKLSTGYWVSLNYATKTTADTGNSNDSTVSPSLYKVKVDTTALNVRTGPGTNYSSKGLVFKGATYSIVDTNNGWGKMEHNGYWIKLSYTIPLDSEFNVKVSFSDLNMRTGPSITYARKGYINPGTYTIVEVNDGWGKVKSNGYWIKLSYTDKI